MSTAIMQGTGVKKDSSTGCPPRAVVAVIVRWRNRIALFRRSQTVGHDRGRWHCITGYLEAGVSPRRAGLRGAP
jgi:hypothetical protein